MTMKENEARIAALEKGAEVVSENLLAQSKKAHQDKCCHSSLRLRICSDGYISDATCTCCKKSMTPKKSLWGFGRTNWGCQSKIKRVYKRYVNKKT